ncbi:hypothetical protein PVAND_016096 [Polypedilum vanderplanki]|uniref:Zinc finger protein n=1 Tax=Polypedilum vanderplanki TaxID=319348 RepID=A0A9J6BEU9_POLVA|nr:hypothetical protein PVAND_016096 [Polypedilum vanderplanki]
MDIFDSSDILEHQTVLNNESQEVTIKSEEPVNKSEKNSPKKSQKRSKRQKLENPAEASKKSDEQNLQCRLCLATINTNKRNSFVKLTKDIERKFNDVTQKVLHNSDQLSKILCSKCEKDLKNAIEYREKLINIQNQLESQLPGDKFENVVIKCEVKDESYDDPANDYNFSLFDSTQLLDQMEDEIFTPEPFKKVIESKEEKRARKDREKKDPRVICPECGVIYANKQSLKKHIANVHIKLKKFQCDNCNYSTTTKHSLKSHMKVHIDKAERRVHNCDKCSFVSVCQQSLKRHLEYEHSGISYECICGKKFNQKGTLQTHIKCVHDKKRDFVCECGKQYFKKRDLEDHIKLVHNPKPTKDFNCEKCGRSFYTRKQLSRHLVYHTDLQFQCRYCEKAYHTDAKLKRHMKTHEGNRDLLCHLCEKSYFFTRDLQRHLDVVHKQTIYFCEFCEFTNSRKDYLGNHLKTAHHLVNNEERNEVLARAKFIKNNV